MVFCRVPVLVFFRALADHGRIFGAPRREEEGGGARDLPGSQGGSVVDQALLVVVLRFSVWNESPQKP